MELAESMPYRFLTPFDHMKPFCCLKIVTRRLIWFLHALWSASICKPDKKNPHIFHSSVTYKPLKGSSYISLLVELANKKAIINMNNDDNECFKWCVTRALNPTDNNPQRITNKLIEQSRQLDWSGIEFSVAADASVITKF